MSLADRGKLREAFRLLILDSEGKYDDCLLARFLKKVSALKGDDAHVAIDCLTEIYSSDDLKEANLSRLFTIHLLTLFHSDSLDQNATYLKKHMPQFITQQRRPWLTALIHLLTAYIEIPEGHRYIIEEPFHEPVEVVIEEASANRPEHTYKVVDSLDLIKYCLENSRNYFVLESARNFLLSILQKSYCRADRPYDQKVIKVIDDMMLSGNHEMYLCMKDLMSMKLNNKMDLYHHKCRPIISKAFYKAIDEDNTKDLMILSTMMSYVTETRDAHIVLDALKRVKNLEAIIVFASKNIDYIANKDILKFIVYPILTRCETEDAQVMIPRLYITREEGIFIDHLMKDKYLMHCFSYIESITSARKVFFNAIAQRKQIYLFEVVLEYLKCHQTSLSAYKNILQCLSILEYVHEVLHKRSDFLWIFKFMNDIIRLIVQLDPEKPMHRPILMGYIKLLGHNLYRITHLRGEYKYSDKISDCFRKVVDLTLNYKDCDLLSEFVTAFSPITSSSMCHLHDDIQREKFVELVWDHLRVLAIENDHPDLLGSIAGLLLFMDKFVDAEILRKRGIRQFHDIPNFLGDILTKNEHRIHTIEVVMRSVSCKMVHVRRQLKKVHVVGAVTYLSSLEENNARGEYDDCLDHVIRGLCSVAVGESDSDTRLRAIDEIRELTTIQMNKEKCPKAVMDRLIKNRTMRTMYEITIGSLHPVKIRLNASRIVTRIQCFINENLADKRVMLTQLMQKNAPKCREDNDPMPSLDMFETLVNFYEPSEIKPLHLEDDTCGEISLQTYIDEIIDQQHNSTFLSECY